jgi:hypothetical protein
MKVAESAGGVPGARQQDNEDEEQIGRVEGPEETTTRHAHSLKR